MKHKWTYANIGGNTRVVIRSGKDIAHLGELDEKLWTVLACPVSGLEIADESLALIDHNHDQKIHVLDVVHTAEWLCEVLVDADVLMAGKDSLEVKMIKNEAIRQVADALAQDGVVTLADVKAAIAGVSVEVQTVQEAPYEADVIAAYKACAEAYGEYYKTAKLQALGLAALPADAVAPGMSEEQFTEMGKQIGEWEAAKTAAEQANATALAAAQAQYKPLEKLLLLNRDFVTLLRNFVSFEDFYAKRRLGERVEAKGGSPWAIFQAGTLVIDQRACNLCLKVSDMTKHNTQAPDSGMFLIYCNCTHHESAQSMLIVAAMTIGNIRHLKVGKNALFYDRQGRDWEAEVVKIIDNPISIRQAFWSPYRKLGNWVNGLISKSAAEKEKKSFTDMTTKLQTTPAAGAAPAAAPQPAPFDIAKFAGIFAAIGMAVGYIGSFFTSLAIGLEGLGWWGWLVIPGLLLIISGPSMILAWMKLRKRNLAPLLNANGWAINADAIVSVLFGNTLTEQAQFPIVKLKDPFAKKELSKTNKWSIAIAAIVLGIGIAVLTMWWLGIRVVWCTC